MIDLNKVQNWLIKYTSHKVTRCDMDELKFIRETENARVNKNIKGCVGK